MILSEIRDLSGVDLAPYARREVEIAGTGASHLLHSSREVYLVSTSHPVCVVGVLQPSFLGMANFWFLLCTKVERGDLRELRLRGVPELLRRYSPIETAVELGYSVGDRFARFFGFVPKGEKFETFGRVFQTYEARL